MSTLKAIQGNKPKQLAQARILQCKCGSRSLIETRTGVAVGAKGNIIHRGTVVYRCADCGKAVQ